MELLKTRDHYATSDVYLASSLLALGHTFVAIDRDEPTRCKFIFDNSTELQESVDAFWRKHLALEPQTLFTALRSLKWQLHAK
jgi:hypothetical protein